MIIPCKILSNDYLIYQKLESYIKDTPYFILEEKGNVTGNEQVFFWDFDNYEVDHTIIYKVIEEGCLIFFISSIIPRELLYKMFEDQIHDQIGFMRKNITYSHFIDEISNVFDGNFEDKKVL
ncbi:hypothetical protein [uncultured Chryseobacterium sp.]|uniref:hypothetical protein n=1 Tax=uncultured Chryseobacterium sp. TaxID=259322 RepID=UPI0025E933AC|nr:hypothetical protein [uncultured Chryseobacterium sp.]